MKVVIPHLSVEGYIESSPVIMIKIFEHFLAADYSQSNTFNGLVSSMKYLLHHYDNNLDLKREMTSTLYNLYSRYFPTVEVTVIIDESDASVDKISIDIQTIDANGVENMLSKSITSINNSIVNFDELMEEMNS